jgi:hypothetical protein
LGEGGNEVRLLPVTPTQALLSRISKMRVQNSE